MPYVKITGYLLVDQGEVDDAGTLTEAAYRYYIGTDPHIEITDLEDVAVEADDR